jgi:predicted CXXCH cytochrome family protein/LSD1 subclass zinc finger protein
VTVVNPPGAMRRVHLSMVLAAAFASGCAPHAVTPAPATYVGVAACARCHATEARAWLGSHHDLAMQVATDSTVLGDFHDAEFRYGAVTSRFFRSERRFMVRTDGPDGKLADYEIRYAFGVDPLQQYLIEFPGGRMQALGIAWDTRSRAQGGQRWFHLHPGERVTHDDELHWTRGAQNWNLQCASCHSTNLRKNYDPTTKTYKTMWSELNVACEGCHGPGSRHVAWAERARARSSRKARGATGAAAMGLLVPLDERHGVSWTGDAATGLPRRSVPRTTVVEVETCARCHSSRTRMFDDDAPGSPLLAAHLPALLTGDHYYADGQVEGEVYEYGSFLQSRMYHEGVTCSDCHDPHRLALRVEGNALCLQCHDARYDAAAHHHHAPGTIAARCVTCHMPSRTFMVVDERHDHSFRVPRPDLADSLGTPNVCASCHPGKPTGWALARMREWYGHAPSGFQRFAPTLAAARRDDADAAARLVSLASDQGQPAIARATALAALGPASGSGDVIRASLVDPDPLIRLAGVLAASEAPSDQRWGLLLGELQRDSLRVLRALAGGALAGVPLERIPAESRDRLARAKADYVAAETENADQPFGLVNLAAFHLAEGDATQAERELRAALEIDPDWVPAVVNLADLLRATGRDAEGETVLRNGLARQPESAALHHALGLLLVRRKQYDLALDELGRAATLAADDPRFVYVYAVALADLGRTRQALTVVERALARRPGDRALGELSVQLRSAEATAPGGR